MADRILKVGLVQQSIVADKEINRKRLAENVRKCAADGAQLVVLQE